MNSNIFGYKHLRFIFRPEFEIKDDSLFYNGKHMEWNEIEKVKIVETYFWELLSTDQTLE